MTPAGSIGGIIRGVLGDQRADSLALPVEFLVDIDQSKKKVGVVYYTRQLYEEGKKYALEKQVQKLSEKH